MYRYAVPALALLGAAAILSLLSRVGHAEDLADLAAADARTDAIAIWGNNCRKCHAGTDNAFATDRAFLRRVTVTT